MKISVVSIQIFGGEISMYVMHGRRSFQRFAYIDSIHINRPLVYCIYRLAFVFIRVFGFALVCSIQYISIQFL